MKIQKTPFAPVMQPTVLRRRCLGVATVLGAESALFACEGGNSTKQPGGQPTPPQQGTPSPGEKIPEARRIGAPEVVATFHDQMPTG